MSEETAPTRALLLILGPMLATFTLQRFVLHHSSPETHVFLGGYLVHHLFIGALLQIPAALALGLGIRNRRARDLARVALGVGSAMVLDEIVFLVCTDGTGVAYRTRVSFWGAFALMTLASGFLAAVYVRKTTEARRRGETPL